MGQIVNTKGLVRSLDIQPNEYLLPLFEVVVNSIQSIEDSENLDKGLITIEIVRSTQIEVETDEVNSRKPQLLGFKVSDNGVGFLTERYNAFNRAFTDFNIKKGGKGVGRYTVLACFGSMVVESVYKEKEKLKRRSFKFDMTGDIQPNENEFETSEGSIGTEVSLNNYLPDFSKFTEEQNITIKKIADSIVDHCLLYFLSSSAPTIVLKDKGEKDLVLNDYFKETITFDKKRETINLDKNEILNLDYLRRYDSKIHSLSLCANNRLVGEKSNLSTAIPTFINPLNDSEDKNYFLSVYVTGNYLDKNVNSQRNRFWLKEQVDKKSAFDKFSLDEIVQKISEGIQSSYSGFISKASEERDEKVKQFILNPMRPRLAYKHLLEVEGAFDAISSNASDEKIETELHKKTYLLEKKRSKAFDKVFSKKKYDKEEFGAIVSTLLKEEAAFSKGKLADMLIQRKSVIKLFSKYLEWRNNENYMLEEDLHNIVFTMGSDSSSMPNEYHNLWLLDERLAFFNFIASDKQLRSNKVLKSKSAKEPDLMIYDFPWAYESNSRKNKTTVIFEFKRPGRDMNNDKDKKLDSQIMTYYEKLLKSKAKDEKGNFLNMEILSPKFGYVVCELHQELIDYNKNFNGFEVTPQGTLYKINPKLNLHMEVMTFQDLLDSVEERHQAFFRTLGIDNL